MASVLVSKSCPFFHLPCASASAFCVSMNAANWSSERLLISSSCLSYSNCMIAKRLSAPSCIILMRDSSRAKRSSWIWRLWSLWAFSVSNSGREVLTVLDVFFLFCTLYSPFSFLSTNSFSSWSFFNSSLSFCVCPFLDCIALILLVNSFCLTSNSLRVSMILFRSFSASSNCFDLLIIRPKSASEKFS